MISTHFKIALRFTLITTLLFGLAYPLLMTGYAQLINRDMANGQLVSRNGTIIGSRIIGQGFAGESYFHERPSAAGSGYDATSSGGSNYGLSSQKLISRIDADTKTASLDHPGSLVPAELVEASGSGLDPDISPAAASFQIDRVARARHLTPEKVESLVKANTQGRQFGILGEPRVNVLTLNLALDNQQ